MWKIKTNALLLLFAAVAIWSSCEDYATNVDPLIDKVADELLTSESQVPFVINGVKTRFAATQDQLMVMACMLSDEFFFDGNLPGASWPQYNEIDLGEITLDNASVSNMSLFLGELRFYADDLVRRVGEISFTNADLKESALFQGNLYGGIARYLYATYLGINPNEGGGVIDNGPFIPSAEMYSLAIEKFKEAIKHTRDGYELRIANSLLARTYLFKGDYANALTAALNGMAAGDAPFQGLHSLEANNYFWQQAGAGRTQGGADYRFNDYIIADPKEAHRVLIEEIKGNDGTTTYYRQAKYPVEESPVTFISWQENELMLAELELRSGNSGSALNRVNNVRASHGIDPLAAIDMRSLIVERDKELCFTGVRLPDQRRFDGEYQTWHLTPDKWYYLPITDNERNINPNIP
ncbi:MAG: RagB/SusD family nutrient uptake outer membrane protein [candidate division KSB1 bacterium]|nr:RagB/SusD family nutrient uptake outer membrane protein [candidate division KSB1 bacterium]MDZ7342538.1 RagB/SusD family nutrient uptake outer membrane protein [candidate division KSB1 bacterium]